MAENKTADPNKTHIFDTTLRDGEQVPGAKLNLHEKLEIARRLERLNVDVIEAGFPRSSPGDFESVARIAEEIRGPEICGLARAVPEDIEVCAEAIKGAEKPRLHTFIGTSDVNIRSQLRKTRDEALKIAVDAVSLARSLCETVEFSPMDATRTEPAYLRDVVTATIEAGASVINIPDTVGYAVPRQFGKLIQYLFENVPNIDQARLSVHCHDDLGMATINSLTAVQRGARQIECTINGVGERAGNASLEECVMAMRTRQDYFGDIYTDINTKEIMPISRVVRRLMNMPVPPNKPIVGDNAFAHSSGIHQDGYLKNPETFEIMNPADVGISESKLILTARSGRRALRHRLEELGYELSEEQFVRVHERFVRVADQKKEVTDADLEAIVKDETHSTPPTFLFNYMQALSGTNLVPTTTISVKRGDETLEASETGNGPVDALYKAIERVTGVKMKLESYAISSVTGGKDAMGEVTVRVRRNGSSYVGVGASPDVLEASAKAMLDAINKAAHEESV